MIAYFAVGFMVDLMSKADEGSEETLAEDDLSRLTSDATGILSLLLIGTDEYPHPVPPTVPDTALPDPTPPSAEDAVKDSFDSLINSEEANFTTKIIFMSLVSYNSYRQQVTVTSFPVEMTVPANNMELDLDTAYYYAENELYGLTKDYFVHAVSATVGMQIDYSATIDVDDYVKVADNLGGLTVDCPEGDGAVGVSKGNNTLSSTQLRKLLTKDDYADPQSKTKLVSNMTTAALDRICSTAYYVKAFEEFDRISPMLGNTTFDEEALTQWRSLIFSYKFYTLQKLSPLGTYGTEEGKTVFKIDRNGTVNFFKQYMQNDQT